MRITNLLATALAIVLLGVPASASAGWVAISKNSGTNTDESSAVRGSDGRLHVVYPDNISLENRAVGYRTITRSGGVGPHANVFTGWIARNNPDVELIGGNPFVSWGGQGSINNADPTSSGRAWFSRLLGGAWSMSADSLTESTSPSSSSQFSTAVDSSSQPWSTWTQTAQLHTHTGIERAGVEQNLSQGCCEYAANIERDAVSGAMFLVYYSNVTGATGYYMRRLTPALGVPTLLRGSRIGGAALGRLTRLSAAARTTGKVYSAYCTSYPTCTSARVGTLSGHSLRKAFTDANRPTSSESLWTAAAPDGRMWLSWANRSGVYATRSNKMMTRWGAIRKLKLPRDADTVWQTNGEGSLGPLDLFANMTVGAKTLTYHHRIKPPLMMARTPGSVFNDKDTSVVFTVTDAGDGARARITFLGTSRTANVRGRATFRIPRGTAPRTYTAVARLDGYVNALAKVAVRTR